ncbi:type II toxin-antitoxin system VapC family toxin [Paracoccus sp. (in: a-proteobacteria)]|uniref:type II toxin-antitoxin system VapC family toxin n=1 Tax=Paracoccus sp. TaxID=267 RepID=UPI0026DEBA91|nr:type II toxin-antitoxin system VapC family toxin [Paracoccus sp. (in: a-proteobacteria)]MDO5370854.1 type II toxin-antitoxin system VapC family toxin [Paracoccus sp. (in: a-proteobacteria)]
MNLLIDTHLLIWGAVAVQKLPPAAVTLMSDPDNQLHFSIASLWEIAIKFAQGRADFTVDPSPFRAGLLANGYLELPVEGRHCLAIPTLPPVHGDPFDRMLVAQAMAEGMQLLTADRRVAEYGGPVRMV